MDKIPENLLDFHTGTQANFLESIKSSNLMISRLKEINVIFAKTFDCLRRGETATESLFVFKAHSSYMSAVRLACGGQSSDIYPLLRSMLEMSLYAWYVNRDKEMHRLWSERMPDDDNSRDKMRRAFSYNKIIKAFEKENEMLARATRKNYELTIEWGAHPNRLGIFSGVDFIENEGAPKLSYNYLHSPKRNSFHIALKEIASLGVGALAVFHSIYPKKFELAGLDDRLKKAMVGL